MPTRYKILNALHFVLFVLLIIALLGVAVYALEGDSIMEAVCAFVTHFDGKPHTGAGVVQIIDAYEIIPIAILVICGLLLINKIVYTCTVKKYKKNHFIAGNTKSKSERKLFKSEAPTNKAVEADNTTKETAKMTLKQKLQALKEKHASKKVKDVPAAVVQDTEKAVAKTAEKVETKVNQTTMSQLDEILKKARH